jgi:hypothetical protein
MTKTPGFYSSEALNAFKKFAAIANAPGGVVAGIGAHDQSMRDTHRIGVDDEDDAGNNTARKLLSSFASKLPAADRVAFKQAIDQAFPLGPYDELDEPSENPYAEEPDEAEPVGYTGDDETHYGGGPAPFRGRPTRGGKPLPAEDSSYARMFPGAMDIGLDPIAPATSANSQRVRKDTMAMDQRMSSPSDATASYDAMFPGAARIGIVP